VTADLSFRPARRSDASDIALLTNVATHGLTADVWALEQEAAGTYSPIEVGRLHVLREGDDLNWRHATIAESGGEIVGLLLGFREPDTYGPLPAELPAFAVPFMELRREMPGAWYVSMIGVHRSWRNQGIGFQLMKLAQAKQHETEARGLSLIVEDINTAARRLYERCGLTVRAKRPMVPFPGGGPNGEDWLLMARD
jgi:ribosomal protein S18 acetylase RimI-like enzyme